MTNQSNSNDNEKTQFDIFISYASNDKDKAFEICESIEMRGLKCWIAPRNIRAGKEYSEEIIKGIEVSKSLLVVLSESANNSKFVKREVERAVSNGKPIYPFRIEDVKPSLSLELFISSAHWIEAWQGNLIEHIDKLVEELKQVSDELFVHNIKDLPLVDKLLRFAQRNLNAVITISVVVVLGILMFGGNDMPDIPDMGPDSVEDLELKHFTVIMKPAGRELDTKEFSFGISMSNSPNTAMKNNLNGSSYHLKFSEGTELNPNASMSSFYKVLKMTEIPTALTFSYETKDDGVAGPFEYDLSYLVNDMQKHRSELKETQRQRDEEQTSRDIIRIRERIQQRHPLNCHDLRIGPVICDFSTHEDMNLYTQAVSQLLIGNTSTNLPIVLEMDKLSSTKTVGVIKGKYDNWHLLLGINPSSIYSQIVFTDSSKSAVYPAPINDKKTDSIFEVPSNTPDAPKVLVTVDNGRRYLTRNNRWRLVPIVGNEVESITWKIFTNENRNMESSRQGFKYIEAESQLLGFNINSDNEKYKSIKFTYQYKNGAKEVHSYFPKWKEWNMKAAINNIDFDRLVNCRISTKYSSELSTSCSINNSEPIRLLFKDILWGSSPTELTSIKLNNKDRDYFIARFEEKVFKEFDKDRFEFLKQKTSKNSDEREEYNSIRKINDKLTREVTSYKRNFNPHYRDVFNGDSDKSNPTFLITDKPTDNLFFKFITIDGNASKVVQVPTS
ncbi:toll/interleukin-1 receptor domain-containing protein [Paraglaciecola aquimarina]|uniref:Toll/interleukin-1 receptor domain-containing protein n=1 Tax=Paraglaciecola algarum TaxID=3050085 RepID=A0ABS9D6W1_9ALTE|nr:toll/interleukin-1 receptor domain-containing protein [Paraglaciecola sp. G1-23]MCF2947559.1 toll/interleukin-1 receptor domain-containing protein [Paraglaciecola sp. G1-23]